MLRILPVEEAGIPDQVEKTRILSNKESEDLACEEDWI
jgi:hypothetical protein